MATRPTWQGHLRLSLVSCPVALYTATSSTSEVHFNLLHKETMNRIRMIPTDPDTGPVERADLVKGFEIDKGRYVVVTDDEIKAVALQHLKRLDEALQASEHAIALDPNNAESYFIAGNILSALDRPTEALAYFERAIALEPNYPEALNNLGNALQALSRWDEALAVYEQAQSLRANLAPAFSNRGFVLRELGRFDEALEAYEKALDLDPKLTDAHNNLGVILNEFHHYEESLAAFDRAIAIDPDFVDPRWNKSYVLIQTEQYAEGWELYEWRWLRKDLENREKPSDQPQWLGEGDVAGKTFLIRAEQGLGDSLQMLRYAPQLAEMGARVVVAVQTSLGEIVSTIPGVSQVVVEGENLPQHDYYCMMMSLPLAFKTTIDTIPDEVPYVWTSLAARQPGRAGSGQRRDRGSAWPGRATAPTRTTIAAAYR